MEIREPLTVLLVEDDLADAELIREMIADQEMVRLVLTEADSLAAARSRLEKGDFDVLLVDLGLPDSQGIETLVKLKHLSPAVAAVVLTGRGDEKLALEALRNGAEDYLTKGQINATLLVRSLVYAAERQKLRSQVGRSDREIKTLRGLLPMCAWCKNVRDDGGYWKKVETYIEEHSQAAFSHGICPDCLQKLDPDLYEKARRDHPDEFGVTGGSASPAALDMTILLIEDDPADAELLREALSEAGASPRALVQANSLSGGIEYLANQHADVVLTDLGLPDSQGIATFIKLHTLYPETPIVVLTGLQDEEGALRAVRSGAQDYLVKGRLDGTLLLKTLRYALERSRLLAELGKSLRETRNLVRERKNMLSMFAHDIKNTIIPPLGFITRILTGKSKNLQEDLDLIRRELVSAEHLLSDFVEFSRLELNGYRPQREPTDLLGLIVAEIEKVRFRADQRTIRIACEKPDVPLPEVMADRAMMARAVENLLDNAVKYNKPGGEITVRMSVAGGQSVVRIQDTGIGIPDHHIPHVFEPFYRAATDQQGSGLGLFIVKSIIEAHEGEVWVASSPDRGTTFTFALPNA